MPGSLLQPGCCGKVRISNYSNLFCFLPCIVCHKNNTIKERSTINLYSTDVQKATRKIKKQKRLPQFLLLRQSLRVELQGVEPWSKQIRHTLSTCLSDDCLSGSRQDISQPTCSLAEWSFAMITAFHNSNPLCFDVGGGDW